VASSIVVTGAGGLLGANLVMEFARGGHRVAAVHGRAPIALAGAEAAGCDLTDAAAARALLARWTPSLIVHCAAATNVDWCEANPVDAMRINATAAGELAAYARAAGCGFVYVSTDAVFDGVAGGYSEDDAIAPVNEYARSKAAGEEAVLRAMPEALVLRINIYGWNMQSKSSLAEWILERLEQGEPVPGFRDTDFAPVLVNDAAAWILRLTGAGRRGIWHAASADHASKYEFARSLADAFGLDGSLVRESWIGDSSLSAPRPRNTWLRAGRLAAELGEPLPTIRRGLEKFRMLREDGFCSQLKAAGAAR
jgi:dTDP-4-dehydrorhamnose reductase